ncbi:MAG: DUF1844 domain-containing protein [Planctomycetota bacterium]|nr:DUF1844 domain-containing protein [Planctomycetota bacterium]
MAEEQPSLHIDTDWKKQAQEEKKRLAEQEQKKAATPAAPKPSPAEPAGMPRAGAGRGERTLPPATFTTLVQSIVTQVLFYLGELSARGAEPNVNLDMAKHNIDMLGVIEEKTKGNLTDEEQRLLDGALYEARMRYVSIAQQVAMV